MEDWHSARGQAWRVPAAIIRRTKPGRVAIVVAVTALLAAALAPRLIANHQTAAAVPAPGSLAALDATARTPHVCNQRILRSPFHYHGNAGRYRSGAAGLPTYGTRGSDFPRDTRGVVLPAQTKDYQNWMLSPNTVYYLEAGTHIGSFAARTNDAFVGGYYRGEAVLSGNYGGRPWAVDSNSSHGDQRGVTIEYLTIERYQPPVDAAALNQDGNTGWTISYNTIKFNVPGAGTFAATGSRLRFNCLTLNGQYGFQSAVAVAADRLTMGPYNIIVRGNEISYNDTCDLSGLISNRAVGWVNHNPVPKNYRNPECGKVNGDGNQGGFKLWETDGVTVVDNNIHNNWGPGGWADTDNANTTWTGNSITNNENAAIIEEISYNFSITNNYLADNDWTDGLGNPGFPQPAIYISESGSAPASRSVPACPETACARAQRSYPDRSVISGNTLVDNGGSIFLWENSNRSCGDGYDNACTLFEPKHPRMFTAKSCKANLPLAKVNTRAYVDEITGASARDWWDGCQWETANVSVTKNVIDFNPAHIPHCRNRAWPDCGAGGIFSEYGGPGKAPGWAVATQLTFDRNNTWASNSYYGPSTFYAWNQGSGANPVGWRDWTGSLARGDKCSSRGERTSGSCDGPFGQDRGSTYAKTPLR